MEKIFTEKKAEDFLKKFIPVADSYFAKNKKGVIKVKFGSTIVMKIISDQALHKSDIGGVRIVKRDAIEKEFESMKRLAKKRKIKLDGILIQEHLEGVEVVIGIKKDPTFGHVIMFGSGGIIVELIKDVTFRVCPINDADAESMIKELKTGKILTGYRGKCVNTEFLKKVLIKVSKIPIKYPKIKELDINPFIINKKTGKVADARIVFEL
jgi:hypothetical protein